MASSTLITDYLGKGIAAARPVSPPVAAGALALWYSTDTGELDQWNGSAWVSAGSVTKVVAGAGLNGGTITSTGTIGLGTIAAGDVLANTGTVDATPAGVTVSALLDKALGTTQGDVVYRGASAWSALPPGTAGQVLLSGGTGANPSWGDQTGGGIVAIGNGLTLNAGTLSADWQAGPIGGLGGGLVITGALLEADWNAGTVSAIGAGLTLTAGGTLQAAGGGTGTVTEIDTGAGLHGGPITGTGTITADWNAGTVASVGAGLVLNSGTLSLAKQPYTVALFAPGTLTASQVLLLHEFPAAVTFPANFGASTSGGSSQAGASANATGAVTISIAQCPAASDPTVGGNFVNVGTVSIGAGGHAGTFSSGGSAVAFAAGDFLKVTAPASADATLANVFATLVGDR